ncbi:MAG TPA: sugar ABC transporter permease [bacterium]|nr:sugar ABC transporter permease [bacterium]
MPASRTQWARMDVPLRLLNLPSLVLIAAFTIVPVAYVAYLSTLDLRIGAPASGGFAGLANYRFVLSDGSVATAFRNTVYFAVLSVAVANAVGLGIALLLDTDAPGSGWLVVGAVLAWGIPEIVNASMWQWIYNPTFGSLNGLLVSLHVIGGYRAWLSTPASAMHAVIFAYSWKLVPFVVIILYAALRSVPADYYESAQLDGAGSWARFRYITVPFIAPALTVAVLFCAVWSMRAFDIIYVLTSGGPGEATTVLSYFTFAKAFQFGDLGAAAAVACLLTLMTLAITFGYWRALPQGDGS